MRRTLLALLLGVLLPLVLIQPAHAVELRVRTTQKNDSRSSTGAIYHCVRDGRLIAPAYVAEPGQKVTFRCAFNTRRDRPFGVKVWQPRGKRVKTYYLGIRLHNYAPPDRGRDVWVDKGSPDGTYRTRIYR